MNIRDAIAGKRTEEEYKKMREEETENMYAYLESNAIPIPEAFVKICKMVESFNYSIDHAECIEKYIRQYVISSNLVDCNLKELLFIIIGGLQKIRMFPEREIFVDLVITDDGIYGGTNEKEQE